MTTERPQRIAPEDLQQVVDDPLSLELRDDVDALVPRLSTQSFVQAALGLREEERLDLLIPHATGEQLTGLLDLDGWRKDRVEISRTRAWLAAIVECVATPDRPRGDLVRLMYEMDPEMWTYALIAGTAIGEIDPEDEERRQQVFEDMAALDAWETPDGLFLVGVPHHPSGSAALRILEAVYADSLETGRRLVNSIRGAIAAEIEEDLLGWRRGRLADMGFPEWEDAMKLFVPLGRAAVLGDEPAAKVIPFAGAEPPVVWSPGADLLRRVMSRLDDEEYGLRSREFLLLVHELIAAQRMEPGDPRMRERAFAQAQATLNLALETLLGEAPAGDAEAFLVERVSSAGLRRLFRYGYAPLAKLRAAVQTLHRHGGISIDRVGSLLDRPWGPAARTLSQWLPELPTGGKRVESRPLRTLSDVADATRLIAEAAALLALTFGSGGYAVDPIWLARADEPGQLRLGDLVRTAVVQAARARAGEQVDPFPLAPADLLWARSNLLDANGSLLEHARADFRERCAAVAAASSAPALEQNLLTRLEVELAAIALLEEPLDPSKIGGFFTIQQVGGWLTLRDGTA